MEISSNLQNILEISRSLSNDLAGIGLSSIQKPARETILRDQTKQEENYDPLNFFDRLITDPSLIENCRKLYMDGHYSQAVETACKTLNNYIRARAKSKQTGTPLMQSVFRFENPVLKINSLKSGSEQDEQHGYQFLFAGLMLGIRNPRSHENEFDTDMDALELMVFINHLFKVARNSKKVRNIGKQNNGSTS
jgi:uncharacterized protein (TIGR02391 family)